MDTLLGLTTGTPDGGVSVFRLSGPQAIAIACALVGRRAAARRLVLAKLRLPDGGEEECMVVFMDGPHSFTGEDVVEFHIHGGERNVEVVREAILAQGGVAAGPGDFSKRAFANGRRSLDELEGMAALIAARSRSALDQARRLIAGELGREVELMGAALEHFRVEIEAYLDFPEDFGEAEIDRFLKTAEDQLKILQRWRERFELGRRAREGARVVLAGPPNAGKSALFNALLAKKRALVSNRPGTTRDYVESQLELEGREIVLVDTAGLRSSTDDLEEAGMLLSEEQIEGADMLLWIEAADQRDCPARERMECLVARSRVEVIFVENKRDLTCTRPSWLGVIAQSEDAEQNGLAPLRERIVAWFGDAQEAWIGLARHRARAHEAEQALAGVCRLLRSTTDEGKLELVAFELQVVERRLGEIRGHSGLGPVGSDILNTIFSSFCIGK